MSDNDAQSLDRHDHPHHEPEHRRPDYVSSIFLGVVIALLPSGPCSDSIKTLAVVFVAIVLEAIPFMLVGSLIGGFIEAFVSRDGLTRFLPQRGLATVLAAAGAGIVFPVCECAVVPVVRRLVNKGLPLSAAIAFLLGGPIVNPVVAASTALAYAFDWRIVLVRLALGYAIAVFTALFMNRLFDANAAFIDEGADGPTRNTCCDHAHSHASSPNEHSFPGGALEPSDDWVDKAGEAFIHAKDDFLAVGPYLVIGAFIAAAAQSFIDRSTFLALTQSPMLSIGIMMGGAISLNLCSEADAFVAASFRGLVSVPAQMAFMLTGPMFDLKLLLMYQTVFRPGAIIALAALILAAVSAVSFGLESLMDIVS